VQEALAAARQARDIRPNYLPAIMAEIDALLRLREDRQALYLAREHVTRVQSPHLAARLVELCVARGDLENALEALQIAEFYGRHAEPPFQQWLLDRRCLAAYRLGRLQESRDYALRLTDSGWHQDFAARLDRLDPSIRPVQLAVPYVPQSHLACVPALELPDADAYEQRYRFERVET
jgi:hypothetical protein